jgi:hypothetical protein
MTLRRSGDGERQRRSKMLGWAALRARTRGEEGESSWGGVCGEAGVPFYRVAREATAVKPSRHRGRRNGKEKKGGMGPVGWLGCLGGLG